MTSFCHSLLLLALTFFLTACTTSQPSQSSILSNSSSSFETSATLETIQERPTTDSFAFNQVGDTRPNLYDESIETILQRYDLNETITLMPEVTLELESVSIITTSNLKAAYLDHDDSLKNYIDNDSYRSLVFSGRLENNHTEPILFKGFQNIQLSHNSQSLQLKTPLEIPYYQLSLPQTSLPLMPFEGKLELELPTTLSQLSITTWPLESRSEVVIAQPITFTVQLVSPP
ncbi:hypothetical protein ACWN8P_06750 [Vagococcus salmoninarum]|uniref:Lipid/polyisoprenoid-binding YceI-like domain-containing protein n=1 Tax=Vagococcus salmoninarum TaxID=2739 RepID=A0A429ZP21_9ENTE|nr:hypothetical protein [Vagococcus salmoninarum]RST95431.1 hypothetical protein CBF35_07685 [Vagococcus salmoninarum]